MKNEESWNSFITEAQSDVDEQTLSHQLSCSWKWCIIPAISFSLA